MDSVDDFSEDLGAKTGRLSLAMVGFMVGFNAETIRGWSQCRNGWCSSSFTSTPSLGRGCAPASWIEVAFRGLECLLVDRSGYRLWLCLLVDRSGFWHTSMVGFSISAWWVSAYRCDGFQFRVAVGLFCGCCGFVLFYCRRFIILL